MTLIDVAFRHPEYIFSGLVVSLRPKIQELKPNLPILTLYNGYDPTAAKVDGSLHGLDSPEAVVEMIGFLVARRQTIRGLKSAFPLGFHRGGVNDSTHPLCFLRGQPAHRPAHAAGGETATLSRRS
jgi:hypothetical protein